MRTLSCTQMRFFNGGALYEIPYNSSYSAVAACHTNFFSNFKYIRKYLQHCVWLSYLFPFQKRFAKTGEFRPSKAGPCLNLKINRPRTSCWRIGNPRSIRVESERKIHRIGEKPPGLAKLFVFLFIINVFDGIGIFFLSRQPVIEGPDFRARARQTSPWKDAIAAERGANFPIKKTLTKSSESAKLSTRKLFILIQSIHLLSFENYHRILSEGRSV